MDKLTGQRENGYVLLSVFMGDLCVWNLIFF
jgi:hypothetical protein